MHGPTRICWANLTAVSASSSISSRAGAGGCWRRRRRWPPARSPPPFLTAPSLPARPHPPTHRRACMVCLYGVLRGAHALKSDRGVLRGAPNIRSTATSSRRRSATSACVSTARTSRCRPPPRHAGGAVTRPITASHINALAHHTRAAARLRAGLQRQRQRSEAERQTVRAAERRRARRGGSAERRGGRECSHPDSARRVGGS